MFGTLWRMPQVPLDEFVRRYGNWACGHADNSNLKNYPTYRKRVKRLVIPFTFVFHSPTLEYPTSATLVNKKFRMKKANGDSVDAGGGYMIADPSIPGYKEYLAKVAVDEALKYECDWVHFDCLMPHFSHNGNGGKEKFEPASKYSKVNDPDSTVWRADVISCVQHIRDECHRRDLWLSGNVGAYWDKFATPISDLLDASMNEYFVTGEWPINMSYQDVQVGQENIITEQIQTMQSRGRQSICVLRTNPANNYYDSMIRFGVGAYMMGRKTNDTCILYPTDTKTYWHPVCDSALHLGEPLEPARLLPTGWWWRPFKRGRITLNVEKKVVVGL